MRPLLLCCRCSPPPGSTWEERDHSEWAAGRLKALLAEARASVGSLTVGVSEVTKLEGHANVVVVRGRPRYGFDYEAVTLTWTAAPGDVKGTAELHEARGGAGGGTAWVRMPNSFLAPLCSGSWGWSGTCNHAR